MKKTILVSSILIYALILSGAEYFTYDKPASMSPEVANSLMAGENNLGINVLSSTDIVIDGMIASDMTYDFDDTDFTERNKDFLPDFIGIVGIKNTMPIEKTYLINGPANIRLSPPANLLYGNKEKCINHWKEDCKSNDWRAKYPVSCTKIGNQHFCTCIDEWINHQCETAESDCPLKYKKCDGHVIGKFENNILVLATQQYKDWFFVTDGKNSGWTAKQNLKEIPAGKIYLKEEIKNPAKFFTDKTEAYEVWANLRMLQLMTDYNPQDKNLKNYCPKNISLLEQDGFVSNQYPPDLAAQKYQLYLLCNGLPKPLTYKEIENVKLKAAKCACFDGSSFEDYLPAEFTQKDVFYTEVKGQKEYSCQLREHHVVCYAPNPCDTEGCGFWPIEKICPKSCMTWTEKNK